MAIFYLFYFFSINQEAENRLSIFQLVNCLTSLTAWLNIWRNIIYTILVLELPFRVVHKTGHNYSGATCIEDGYLIKNEQM